MTIKMRLMINFLVVAIVPVTFVSGLNFSNAKMTLIKARIAELEKIANLKADKIETFFNERAGDIKTAQDYFNIKTNLPVMARFADNRVHSDYIAAKAMLDGQLKTFQKVYGYMDVMLVAPDGRIVYVTNEGHETSDLGNPLPDPDGKAFEEGQKGVHLSDVFINKVKGERFVMLVTAPAHDFEGRFIGVIALEVDMNQIYRFIQETWGLGETGETLVGKKVSDEALFLNPLRHDQEAALKRKVKIGSKIAVPIQEAVAGRDGSGLSIDYRGEEIIAVWRHIPLLDWGMVAKIDAKEAFASVDHLRNLTLMIGIVTLLAVGFVAILTAQSIARPILTLQQGMETVGNGRLDYKVGTKAKDEVGQLSRAFDKMTENLARVTASRDTLNQEVAERKAAEAVLAEKMAELERSNKELDDFAYIASHDLKEPLRGIHNYSKFIMQDYKDRLDDDGRSKLMTLTRLTQRMEALINSLLYYSRVGRADLNFEACDLNQVVAGSLDALCPLLEERHVKIEIPNPLPKLRCDPVRVGEIFQNLIMNGIKYNDKPDKLIEIGFRQSGSQNGSQSSEKRKGEPVVFSVRDNGIGIREKHFDSIFRIFKRLHGRDKYGGGVGAGLTTIKKIVERHGGEVWIESAYGEGTTFYFTLATDARGEVEYET